MNKKLNSSVAEKTMEIFHVPKRNTITERDFRGIRLPRLVLATKTIPHCAQCGGLILTYNPLWARRNSIGGTIPFCSPNCTYDERADHETMKMIQPRNQIK